MDHFLDRKRCGLFWSGRIACSLGVLVFACGYCRAQATTEAAGLSSVSATAVSGARTSGFPSAPKAGAAAKSPHMPALPARATPEENRRELEQHAGPNAARVLFHTKPSDAVIWINGKPVGNAPLLVFVAPGKYQVEFRGQRQEYAKAAVDLLPKETRELSFELTARYPTRVSVQAH